VATVSVFCRKSVGRSLDTAFAEAETTLFFAGEAVIELHRTETTNYRDNLASGAPALWVACVRQFGAAVQLLAVTADPAEGEAFTDAGSNLVEAVPMPPDIAENCRSIHRRTSCRAALSSSGAGAGGIGRLPAAATDRRGGSDHFRSFRLALGAIEAQRRYPAQNRACGRPAVAPGGRPIAMRCGSHYLHSRGSMRSTIPLIRPVCHRFETITGNTDIRGFLQSRVPAELTRAALRQPGRAIRPSATSSASPRTSGI